MSISISEAIADVITKDGRAIITEYQFFLLIRNLYKNKKYDGQNIRVRKRKPDLADSYRLLNELIGWSGILEADQDFKSGVYRVISVPDQSADELCCEVDPFCYISHLSAMQYYGLTNRTPVELSLTTPARQLWNKFRDAQMEKDYGDDLGDIEYIVNLKRYEFGKRVRDRRVQRHQSLHPGEWRQVRGKATRVSSIGQTFLDMLDKSSWCGGINHVMEVWENEARNYLEEVISAVNRAPTAIDKVRAGYLLDERLGIQDRRINQWLRHVQRGGSRRLDPESPYQSKFSEKWMISLNV
jgi:predicted transcriptional regulator of viral defense system